MSNKNVGQVKWFNNKIGYGFITLMIPTFLEYDIIKTDDKVLGDLIEVLAFC